MRQEVIRAAVRAVVSIVLTHVIARSRWGADLRRRMAEETVDELDRRMAARRETQMRAMEENWLRAQMVPSAQWGGDDDDAA